MCGNREEMYDDGSGIYVDRLQGSYGSLRINFMCGRGQVLAQFGRSYLNWYAAHDFSFGSYSGLSDYCFAEHNCAVAVAGTGVEGIDLILYQMKLYSLLIKEGSF